MRESQVRDHPSAGLLLTADWVLPVTAPPIREGAVWVAGERIGAVGPYDEVAAQHPDAECRQFGGAVILPGLVNLHTHLAWTALGPLTEPRPFWDWLPGIIERSQGRDTDFWQAAAAAGARQLIAGGITCIADAGGVGMGVQAALAANLAGISFIEAVGMRDRERLPDQLAAVESRLGEGAQLVGRTDRLTIGLSPHAIYTLSVAALTRLADVARARRLPLTMHVAETVEEVEFARYGRGLLAERLAAMGGHDLIEMGGGGAGPATLADRCGLFDGVSSQTRPSRVIAHGVHLDPAEIALLRRRRVAVALCPRSNMMLQCGEAPVQALVAAGVRLGLGSDSLASNRSLDLFAEAGAVFALWQQQAGTAFDSRRAARQIVRWLTIDGARALGLAQAVGSIEPGKYADLAAVRLPPADAAELCQLLCTAVRATDVRCTVTAGRVAYTAAS